MVLKVPPFGLAAIWNRFCYCFIPPQITPRSNAGLHILRGARQNKPLFFLVPLRYWYHYVNGKRRLSRGWKSLSGIHYPKLKGDWIMYDAPLYCILILTLKWVSWQNHTDNVVVDKTVEVVIIECRS